MDEFTFRPRVTVLDTHTGETAEETEVPLYNWLHGDWSCDCNRGLMFDRDPAGENGDHCAGCFRYVAVDVSSMPDGYTLQDFNAAYPEVERAKLAGYTP